MKPMRVICGGLQRSGSTWQYNVVRLLLKRGFGDEVYSAFAADYDPTDARAVHVVKMHFFDEDALPGGSVMLFTCLRDLRAAAASMIRMGWLPDDRDTLLRWCGEYIRTQKRLVPVATAVVRYEDMLADPWSVAAAMAHHLGLPPGNGAAVQDEVARLRMPAPEPDALIPHDRETQLHPGHIGERSNTRSVAHLSPGNLAAIEAAFAPWFDEQHYPASLAS